MGLSNLSPIRRFADSRSLNLREEIRHDGVIARLGGDVEALAGGHGVRQDPLRARCPGPVLLVMDPVFVRHFQRQKPFD